MGRGSVLRLSEASEDVGQQDHGVRGDACVSPVGCPVLDRLGLLDRGTHELSELGVLRPGKVHLHYPVETILRPRDGWHFFAWSQMTVRCVRGFGQPLEDDHAIVADVSVVLRGASALEVAPEFRDLVVDARPSGPWVDRHGLGQNGAQCARLEVGELIVDWG